MSPLDKAPEWAELARVASTTCLVQIVCGLGTEFHYFAEGHGATPEEREANGRVTTHDLGSKAVEVAMKELNRRLPAGLWSER